MVRKLSRLLIVISTAVLFIKYGGTANYCRYFTNLSALYLGIVSLISLCCGSKRPRWLKYAELTAASAATLTPLTVVVFLAPSCESYIIMFRHDMFHFHLLNPLLGILALGGYEKLSLKQGLWGCVPCVAYSVVYGIQVALTKNWPDFYGFTFGGHYGVLLAVIPIMYGVSLLIGMGLALRTRR